MTFQLDTSGTVTLPTGEVYSWDGSVPGTSALPNLAQGYVEAMFASELAGGAVRRGQAISLGFSDLAPETLARIIADCERFCSDRAYAAMALHTGAGWDQSHSYAGVAFYEARNGGEYDFTFTLRTGRGHDWPEFSAEGMNVLAKTFPPLTVSLNDQGKVVFGDGV